MPQDIFERLTSEHEEMKSQMEALSKGFDSDSFNSFAEEINAHMQAEEDSLYQAIRDDNQIHSLVMEGYEAHHTAALLLRELQRNEGGTDRWEAKFEVFKELVEHHIEEEESQVFASAKTIVAERADQLADEYEKNHKRVLSHA